MQIIPVDIAGHPYEVRVGHGLIADLAGQCGARLRKATVPIITDANVHAAWGGAVEASLAAAGKVPAWQILPAGEATKCWDNLIRVTDWLLALAVACTAVGAPGTVAGTTAAEADELGPVPEPLVALTVNV